MNGLQLQKLEAYGFKSFADRMEIEFDRGITAIVGPNGSGKSNITDAIRWVLGEQNMRNLRAAKTEEIIFSGSVTRRPLGAAEVSLTFDNSDGGLPLDFKEVVVTRRLFRSGESEFFINKARCRLKDIHDLFADTGLGRDAISVISQNKIDQVLNSRPEERRLLFEEAAGITKYRNRKRESLRKLEDTQQNILRVSDILREIENQLEPLKEQAEKTRRYDILQDIYRQCKITLLVNRYEEERLALGECAKKKGAASKAYQDYGTQAQLAEVEKERLANELLEVEKSLQLLAAKNSELHGKIEENSKERAISQERLQQREADQERLLQTRVQLENDKKAADTEWAAAKTAARAAREKAAAVIETVALHAAKEEKLRKKAQSVKQEIERRKQRSLEDLQQLMRWKNDLNLQERSIEELSGAQEEIEMESAALAAQRKIRLAAQETLRRETERSEAESVRLQGERQESARALQDADNRRQELRGAAQLAAQELQGAKTRLRFLQGMQEEYEGFGRAAKQVLKNRLPWQSGVCGAVAEVIHAASEHVTAIEIALGGALQHIIVENDQVAKEAIAFLKRERLGRVTFLPLNTIQAPRGMEMQIADFPGVIGFANRLVHCEKKFRPIIDFLLARTIVVDTIDTAMKLARRHSFRIRIVTLEGDMFNPGGSMTGGGSARRESGFLNRAGEIEDLSKKLLDDEPKLRRLEAEIRQADAAAAKLEETAKSCREALQKLEIKRAQQKVYVEKAALERADVEARLTELTQKKAGCSARRSEAQTAASAARQEIGRLESTGVLRREDEEKAADALAALQRESDAAAEETVAQKIAQTIAEQEILRVNEHEKTVRDRIGQNDAQLRRISGEMTDLQQAAKNCRLRAAALEEENKRLQTLRSVGGKDYDNFHQVKMEKLIKIQKNDQRMKELRKEGAELQNELHQLEMNYTKYAFEIEHCAREIKEQYHCSIEAAQALRLADDAAVLRRRIETLQRDMQALGSVNPNAVAEYEALDGRYGFMKKQADDLVAAKAYLMEIVADIDATMTKQFAAAFAQIRVCFAEIFSQLFGGGAAKLELDDEKNILSAGVEISVQPPDKKLQSLAVLSGGERALTVIALLFSFLRYRPAPFSVVDEIDAPLDEANVDRFGEFLRQYAASTQFIVVTHRKGTMQAADVLHGVTVEGSGVSKIISVRLEDQADERVEG